MSATYILDATVEVVPVGRDRFELRSPLWGSRIEANRYQVGLLQRFEAAREIEAVLTELPFHKEESAKFLQACIEEHVLLRPRPDGLPVIPDRSRPQINFAGTPAYRADDPAAFVFLGIPFDANTTGMAGAKFGPTAIRSASEGVRYHLDPNTFNPVGFHDYSTGQRLLQGITIADAGDVVMSPGEVVDRTYDRISSVVRELVEAGSIPMIMGGDHSITYPILRAMPHERLAVIHFDAHTDLGEALPGALLHHGNVFSVVLDKLEYVEHITQVGLRGILDATDHDDHELVTYIGIEQFRQRGITDIVNALPKDVPCYMSIDIDVLDPAFAPATGTPVANGMFPAELKALARAVAAAVDLVGCDIVEVAAPSGPGDSTASLASELFLTIADGLVQGLQDKLAAHDTGAVGSKVDG